jgi:hypothetical protein
LLISGIATVDLLVLLRYGRFAAKNLSLTAVAPARDRSAAQALPLRLPSGLLPTARPAPRTLPAVEVDTASVTVSTDRSQPVQLVRVVPPSGNLTVAQQQVWLGPALAGTPVTIWVDTDRLHVLTADGARIKSSPSRLSQRDLARLLADGGAPAGPPPLPQPEPQTIAVEVDRLVNACGGIGIAGRQVSVGMPLAGQRVRVRLDGVLLHVIDEAGQLRRTLRCPLPPSACGRLRDARPASPVSPPATPPTVERIVSINGSIQVAGQKIQVGGVHVRTLVTVAWTSGRPTIEPTDIIRTRPGVKHPATPFRQPSCDTRHGRRHCRSRLSDST